MGFGCPQSKDYILRLNSCLTERVWSSTRPIRDGSCYLRMYACMAWRKETMQFNHHSVYAFVYAGFFSYYSTPCFLYLIVLGLPFGCSFASKRAWS